MSDALNEAFPEVDPGIRPFGSRLLIQLRNAENKTKGGIILTRDDRETQAANTQVAKVLAVGPLAFKNRNTMLPWPEGDWCKVGDFVRVPKYGGDRFHVDGAGDAKITVVVFNDLDIIGGVTGDPLAVKAFF